MSYEEKIKFILARLGDRLTEAYLRSKPASFVENLFEIESQRDDLDLEEAFNA